MRRYIHYPDVFGNHTLKTNTHRDTSFKAKTKADIISNFSPGTQPVVMSAAISNTRGLKATIDGLISNEKYDQEEIAPYVVEWHKKFTLSVIIVLLFLISAPLGAIIRKGGIGMPLVISVVLFVLFYAINMVGEKIGKEGMVPIWAGMWMSSLVLLPIGVVITYKATKDSTVLSLERYTRFLGLLLEKTGFVARVKNSKTAKKIRGNWIARKGGEE
jgi:lipopolysaccharide export system permease protein